MLHLMRTLDGWMFSKISLNQQINEETRIQINNVNSSLSPNLSFYSMWEQFSSLVTQMMQPAATDCTFITFHDWLCVCVTLVFELKQIWFPCLLRPDSFAQGESCSWCVFPVLRASIMTNCQPVKFCCDFGSVQTEFTSEHMNVGYDHWPAGDTNNSEQHITVV